MKKIKEYKITNQTLNFSSAGLPNQEVTQVLIDEYYLMNAVELIDWDNPDEIQTIVCEKCGTVQCETGGWVKIRQFSDSIVFFPIFDKLLSTESSENSEFTPPELIKKNGVQFFSKSDYNILRSKLKHIPDINYFPKISIKDTIECFKYDAPARILGDIQKDNQPKYDRIHACKGMDQNKLISIFKRMLNYFNSNLTSEAIIIRNEESCSKAIIYLDLKDIPEWAPLNINGNKTELILSDEYALDISNLAYDN